MADFQNNTFIGQRILIDGHRFEGNLFENCVLVYGGGPFHMVNNQLSGVRWEFVDSAARTVALLASFYQMGGTSKEFVDVLLATFGKAPTVPIPTASVAPGADERGTPQ
jgi:hypothetical protein